MTDGSNHPWDVCVQANGFNGFFPHCASGPISELPPEVSLWWGWTFPRIYKENWQFIGGFLLAFQWTDESRLYWLTIELVIVKSTSVLGVASIVPPVAARRLGGFQKLLLKWWSSSPTLSTPYSTNIPDVNGGKTDRKLWTPLSVGETMMSPHQRESCSQLGWLQIHPPSSTCCKKCPRSLRKISCGRMSLWTNTHTHRCSGWTKPRASVNELIRGLSHYFRIFNHPNRFEESISVHFARANASSVVFPQGEAWSDCRSRPGIHHRSYPSCRTTPYSKHVIWLANRKKHFQNTKKNVQRYPKKDSNRDLWFSNVISQMQDCAGQSCYWFQNPAPLWMENPSKFACR